MGGRAGLHAGCKDKLDLWRAGRAGSADIARTCACRARVRARARTHTHTQAVAVKAGHVTSDVVVGEYAVFIHAQARMLPGALRSVTRLDGAYAP